MAADAVRLGEGVLRVGLVNRRRHTRWHAWTTGLGGSTHRRCGLLPIDAVWCSGDHLRNGDEFKAATGVVLNNGGEELHRLCGVRVHVPEYDDLDPRWGN